MSSLHQANIILHVIAGSLALIAGTAALIARKTRPAHQRIGTFFVVMLAIVVGTGAFGVIVFQRHPFLLLITLLAGYNTFSGVRTMRLGGRRPGWIDLLVPLTVGVFAIWYVCHLRAVGFYWAPGIIYGTTASLLVSLSYDLSRLLMTAAFRRKAMLYEHSYKMIGAFSGILSAFTGTVLPGYKPYSQFMPSVLGILGILCTFIWLSRRPKPLRNITEPKQVPHAQSC